MLLLPDISPLRVLIMLLPSDISPLRVLIVEDDPMMQLGLEQSWMDYPQLEVVESVTDEYLGVQAGLRFTQGTHRRASKEVRDKSKRESIWRNICRSRISSNLRRPCHPTHSVERADCPQTELSCHYMRSPSSCGILWTKKHSLYCPKSSNCRENSGI